MGDPVSPGDVQDGVAGVVLGVVGEDAPDADAEALEVSDGPYEEDGCGVGLFVGQGFDVGDPGVVVDGDVEGLEAESLA